MEFPRVETVLPARSSGPDRCVICEPTTIMSPFRSVAGWSLVRCPQCGLVSLSGAGGDGTKVSGTNERFFSSDEFNRWFLSCEAIFRQRYRGDLEQIAALAGSGRLLDVGCGPGLFLDEARARGWDVHGVEASPAPATIARERFALPVSIGALEDVDLPAASFDVVTFFDVLEHLPDPRGTLRHAMHLLRPNGLLVAQSPNLQSVMARITGDAWHWYFLPQHLHHFTPATYQTLLRAAGLIPIRTTTWDVPEEFASNLGDRFPLFRGRSRPRTWLRRALQAGLRAGASAWGDYGLGGLIRCFARKPA